MTITLYMVPEISSTMDRIFCHSGAFLALLQPEKSRFLKNKRNTRKYYHFTDVYHKWQSYDVLFLIHGP